MDNWSVMDHDWADSGYEPFAYPRPYYQEKPQPLSCVPYVSPQAQPFGPKPPPLPSSSPTLQHLLSPPQPAPPDALQPVKRDNPREIRNKAEKQRRDKLNQSISELASMVPPVVASRRKIDKTGILRLTAHYLRSHQYVFGECIQQPETRLNTKAAKALVSLLNGFLLATTYRGIIVVASQNVHEHLAHNEIDLLGQSLFTITHKDDHDMLRRQLMPKAHLLGPNGELLVPDEPDGRHKVEEALARDKRSFIIRFKKHGQRSEPVQYITCHVEGSFRKSDRASRGYTKCCQMVRRARARGENPRSSGNDIVFIGVVRPVGDTFLSESQLEAFRMEYRTRHSVDGEIIQCEHRMSLVTGYMTHEINGVNAMNFMHRDDVRWVIIALREMYDQQRLYGDSCYRLMLKNGQFIYMRTRGRLDLEPGSSSVTSFVCTNTVVDEEEGKHLVKMMKKKFMLMVNNNIEPLQEEEKKDVSDNAICVEDPKQLEKVILHLVTNLPSPQPEDDGKDCSTPSRHIFIIPPKRERIVSAIEKMYNVIKGFKTKPSHFSVSDEDNPDSQGSQLMVHSIPPSTTQPISPKLESSNESQSLNDVFESPVPKVETFESVYMGQTDMYDYEPEPTSSAQPMEIPLSTNPENCSKVISTKLCSDGGHYSTSVIKRHYSVPVDDKQVDSFPQIDYSNMPGCSQNIIMGTKHVINKEPESPKDNIFVLDFKEEDMEENEFDASSQLFEDLLSDTIIDAKLPEIDNMLFEQSLDTCFPDFLISEEVENVLGNIEEN